MKIHLGKRCWQSWRRRLVSTVTLLAYVLVVVGFPIPTTSASAASSSSVRGQRVCCCGSEAKCRASGCGCSHSPLPEPVVSSEKSEPTHSCCSRPIIDMEKPAQGHAKEARKPNPKLMRWVVGISALKCQSGGSQWVSMQAALPGPTPLNWQPNWPYSHTLMILQQYPFFADEAPLDPPPR